MVIKKVIQVHFAVDGKNELHREEPEALSVFVKTTLCQSVVEMSGDVRVPASFNVKTHVHSQFVAFWCAFLSNDISINGVKMLRNNY